MALGNTNRLGFCSLVVVFAFAGCNGRGVQEEQPIPVVSFPKQEGSEIVSWFESFDGRYGLRDKDGKQILEPAYDDVQPFSEGLAAVNVGAEWTHSGFRDGGKWGFVDESGKLVIPIQFEYASSFSDGLANVRSSGGSKTFIDASGDVKLRIPDAGAGNFREGLAPVYRSPPSPGQDWTTEFVDKSGEIQFTVVGYAREFYDGLAVFSIRGGKALSNSNSSFGFVDATGKVVIEPVFGEALHFSNGLAAVRTKKTTIIGMGDSWGYINEKGEYVIDPIYNEAKPFRDGKAVVHQDGQLILTTGPCYWEGGT